MDKLASYQKRGGLCVHVRHVTIVDASCEPASWTTQVHPTTNGPATGQVPAFVAGKTTAITSSLIAFILHLAVYPSYASFPLALYSQSSPPLPTFASRLLSDMHRSG